METFKITKNIIENENIPQNKELTEVFKKMHEFDADEFFYYEFPLKLKNWEISQLIENIDRIIFNVIGYTIDEDNINHLSIIKTTLNYFLKGIKNNDLVSFLIFFQTNIFLRLDINGILELYDLNKEFKPLLKIIASFLKDLKIFTMEMESYNNSDEFIKRIKLDLAIKDNEKLNSTIKLLNLNSIQDITNTPHLIFSELTLKIASFLKDNAFKLFENTLLELDNLLSVTLFVKVCSFDEIIKIYKNNGEKLYKNLIFVFVKKFFDEEYNNVCKYKFEISDILKKLYFDNSEFFNEILNYYDTNELFNTSVGLFICELNENKMKSLIDEFPIRWYIEEKKDKKILLEHCDEEKKSFNTLLELTYEKWENYLNNLNKSNKQILSLKDVLTNFSDFILYNYVRRDDEKIIHEMKETFKNIKYLPSEWTYNLDTYKNRFYIYYSKLYILTFAYEYKKLNNNKIKRLYEEILENTCVKELFINTDYNSINMIKENIFWKND